MTKYICDGCEKEMANQEWTSFYWQYNPSVIRCGIGMEKIYQHYFLTFCYECYPKDSDCSFSKASKTLIQKTKEILGIRRMNE